MRAVTLELRKIDKAKVVYYDPRKDTRARGIAGRDKERNRDKRRRVSANPRPHRSISDDDLMKCVEELPAYPIGSRDLAVRTKVVQQHNMHKFIGIQLKGFNQWMIAGKIPYADFQVITGARGYPPKAFLLEECQVIKDLLNTHYQENKVYSDHNVEVSRAIKAALDAIRFRKKRDLFNSL